MDNSAAKWKMPRWYFRRCLAPMFPAVVLPLFYGFGIVRMIRHDVITVDLIINHRMVTLLILMGGPILSMLWTAIVMRRAMRYVKRFKARNGQLCFACDYDLLEEQTQCPECGADWDLDLLGKTWHRMLKG